MLPATLHGGTQFGDSPAPGQSTLVEMLGRPLTMAETLEEPTEPPAQRPRPPRRGPCVVSTSAVPCLVSDSSLTTSDCSPLTSPGRFSFKSPEASGGR